MSLLERLVDFEPVFRVWVTHIFLTPIVKVVFVEPTSISLGAEELAGFLLDNVVGLPSKSRVEIGGSVLLIPYPTLNKLLREKKEPYINKDVFLATTKKIIGELAEGETLLELLKNLVDAVKATVILVALWFNKNNKRKIPPASGALIIPFPVFQGDVEYLGGIKASAVTEGVARVIAREAEERLRDYSFLMMGDLTDKTTKQYFTEHTLPFDYIDTEIVTEGFQTLFVTVREPTYPKLKRMFLKNKKRDVSMELALQAFR